MVSSGVSIKVLVVDDDERFRINAERLLNDMGFAAVSASCGEQALQLLEGATYDVLVLDQKMPGKSGMQTLEALRRRGCDVEVIFLTGHASVDDAVEGMNLGAADYLLKPLSSQELADKIITAHERRQEKLRRFGGPLSL